VPAVPVAVITKGSSTIILSCGGSIIGSNNEDLQTVDNDAFSGLIEVIGTALDAAERESNKPVDAKKAGIRASLADLLGH
jgi:hypothetical protein